MNRLLIALITLFSASTFALDSYTEHRYCGEPKRNTHGRIVRDKMAIYHFKKAHPCPVTGKTTGACKGWAIDHIIPLANGGCDAVTNMQWLPKEIKSCKGDYCKDRFERRIY